MGRERVDDAELERIYRAHYALVRRLVTRLGVRPHESEDVTHEVFLELAGMVAGRPQEASERAFVAGVARNVVLRHRRSAFRWLRNALALGELTPAECDGSGPETALVVAEVRTLLDALPEDQRVVLVLMDLEEWSAPEVASALRVPLNTVYSRLRLARLAFERRKDAFLARARRST